jgi:hypothetical protein
MSPVDFLPLYFNYNAVLSQHPCLVCFLYMGKINLFDTCMFDVELCYLLIMARPEHQAPADVVSTFINNILSVVEIFFVRLSVTTTSIFNHHHHH